MLGSSQLTTPSARQMSLDGELMSQVVELVSRAKRPVIYAGQGSVFAASSLLELAEHCSAPVFTTASARGVIPEDHALALGFESLRTDVATLNELIASSDLVLAIGCKMSHNGTSGFRLKLPREMLIHVDASAEVLEANYPARLAVNAPAELFLPELLRGLEATTPNPTAWPTQELSDWRERLRRKDRKGLPEPRIGSVKPPSAETLFASLRRVVPRETLLVTDSGQHQVLTRCHFEVLAARGLLLPSDLQSMGFGLPAAIGAKLAVPNRPVVLVFGDGGFAMSGMELLTATREKLAMVVLLLNDGKLGQIRLQQLRDYGRDCAVSLTNPDFAQMCEAMGAAHVRVENNFEDVVRTALAREGVTVIEVSVGDSPDIHRMQAAGNTRRMARSLLGPRGVSWLKSVFRR